MDRIGVLFVCLGNICRSPLAEGVFRHLAREAGIAERLRIDSAGTSGYHDGEGPDPRTSAVAQQRGIVLEHASRRLRAADFDRFRYVLAMDTDNLERIRAVARESGANGNHIALLRDFDPESMPGDEVPDPYFGGTRGFEDVHDMVERACRGLLAHIREQHAL